LTEYALKFIFKELKNLKFFEANGVKDLKYALLDEFKQQKPDVQIRMLRHTAYDKKDNQLRVPR